MGARYAGREKRCAYCAEIFQSSRRGAKFCPRTAGKLCSQDARREAARAQSSRKAFLRREGYFQTCILQGHAKGPGRCPDCHREYDRARYQRLKKVDLAQAAAEAKARDWFYRAGATPPSSSAKRPHQPSPQG